MRVTVQQISDLGRADDWQARADGLPLPGIGRTWGDAFNALIRANPAAFGIESITTDQIRRNADGTASRETFIWTQGPS